METNNNQVTYSGRYPFSIPVIPVHFFVSKDRYLHEVNTAYSMVASQIAKSMG